VKIFISYAEEDRDTVARLREQLTGHEVYDWRDPTTSTSQSIVKDIEDNVLRADAFFVVLSPDYLASGWCLAERAMAHHIENTLPSDSPRFIHVLRVGRIPDERQLGFLRDCRRVDLGPDAQADALKSYVADLSDQLSASPQAAGSQRPRVIVPRFRNREDELRTLRNELTNFGGSHFWIVVAPPQLGKSWLLDRLGSALPMDWRTSLLDLGTQSEDVRRSPRRLVAALFGTNNDDRPDERFALAIASKILEEGRPRLMMVDGGELLTKRTIRGFRQLLESIYEGVRSAGWPSVRLAVVVASRRKDFWGTLPPKPFVPLPLTEFIPQVIGDATRELADADGRRYGGVELENIARDIRLLTAGLPSLVTRTLEWLMRTHWAGRANLRTAELFDEIAGPYVTGQLFSLQSLFPQGGDRQEERRRAIERAFQLLCPYRLVATPHISRIGLDEDFQVMLRDAGWSEDDLWQALDKTALVLQTHPEACYRIFPATRKVIFRLLLTHPAQQARAHADARDFYELWRKDNSAGSEQGSMFIESVWHEASRLAIEEPGNLAQRLLAYVGERVESLSTPKFRSVEMRRYAQRIFEADSDLQELLSQWPGLSDAIAEIIEGETSGERTDE